MGKGLGILCIVLGLVCLLGAIGFVVYNRYEAQQAATATETILEDVQNILTQATLSQQPSVNNKTEMPTISVDGYDCFGVLAIPVLELELPVLADWSYEKLKKAPCHYYGTYYGSDFVIAAHNYNSHFGRLSQLQPGDTIVFTDVTGVAHVYEVTLLETLPKEATREMIASGFDLSLYTCTPGGGSRVTVRCLRK